MEKAAKKAAKAKAKPSPKAKSNPNSVIKENLKQKAAKEGGSAVAAPGNAAPAESDADDGVPAPVMPAIVGMQWDEAATRL